MLKLALAAMAAVAVAAPAFAADPPAPVRTIVQSFAASGAPTTQVSIATAAFAPGARIPMHTHPGEESGVVVSGTLKIDRDGMAPLIVHAGESYLIPRGVAHSPSAPEGETHVVATFVVDKDKPLSTNK
jgi:quercetin dioxygenase-like cupin family protein